MSSLTDINATELTTVIGSSTPSAPSCPQGLGELNIPYTVLESLVAIVAVIGNALVIVVFCREKRLRRRTNFYIISLALADFLIGLLGIPFAILVSTQKFSYKIQFFFLIKTTTALVIINDEVYD